jgi:hypothetical protein
LKRFTNKRLLPCRAAHWPKQKIDSYRDEARLVLEALGAASPFLAERLEKRIANYPPKDELYDK